MSDLVDQFFTGDLTGADEEALERLLLQSPEAASRFNLLAEEAYAATGQPAHQWPGKTIKLPPTGGMGMGLKLFLALLAAGSGMVIWRFWPKTAPEIAPQAVTRSNPLPIQPAVSPHGGTPPKTAPQKILPTQAPQEAEGDELGILVEAPQVSLVTVRVLDSSNKEIRALYTGVLDPGKWSFRWDGLLDNGQSAPGGNYTIEVQKGPHRLSKPVSLLTK